MNIRHCVRILVLSVCAAQLVAPFASWAAQLYSYEDLAVGDAVKASGPNLTGEVTIRSGFSAASSIKIKKDKLGQKEQDDIGLLPGGGYTTTNGINDDGTTVGSANSANAVRAVVWTKTGGLLDLGTLPGDSAAEAFGINKDGAVVGYSSGPAGTRAF